MGNGTVVELIMDASGSMKTDFEGKTRIEMAKEVLITIIQEDLPDDIKVALRVFGASNGCSTELVAPLAPLQKESLVQAVRQIEAVGSTQIAGSLAQIPTDLDLQNASNETKKIVVLVTDGEETCGGDVEAELTKLKEAGLDVRVDIVGIVAKEDDELSKRFESWAAVSGGTYARVDDSPKLYAALKEMLDKPPAATSDPEVAAEVMSKLGELKLTPSADSAPAAGTTTKIGVVVVDFSDARAVDPSKPQDHWNQLKPETVTQWFNTESQNRFSHSFDVHSSVVSLPQPVAAYKGNRNKIADDVDKLLEIPDDWDIVMLCLPNVAAAGGTVVSSRMTCTFDEDPSDLTTTPGERRPTVFIDQQVYGEAEDRGWATVVHELVHALGLRDLYVSSPARSFGWSMMSDCRTARHLMSWEKLTLGWENTDDYFFIKGGVQEATIFQAGAQGKKGVFALDPMMGGGVFVMEWSRPTGKTTASVTADSTTRSTGLLAYRVGWKDQPSVTLYPWKTGAKSDTYGGAPLAPCPPSAAVAEFGRNGLRGSLVRAEGTGADQTLVVRAGKKPTFEPANHAVVTTGLPLLRIDDYLVSSDRKWSLKLDSDAALRVYAGDLSTGAELDAVGQWGPVPSDAYERYEFYVDINGEGRLQLHYGTGPTDDKDVLHESEAPAAVPAAGTTLFLAIETRSDQPAMKIYTGASPSDPDASLVAEVPITMFDLGTSTRAFVRNQFISSDDGKYTLRLQQDGYLTLKKQGEFKWHHTETRSELGGSVVIDDSGAVQVISGSPVWKYTGKISNRGSGPVAIRVTDAGKVEVYDGNTVLYTLNA